MSISRRKGFHWGKLCLGSLRNRLLLLLGLFTGTTWDIDIVADSSPACAGAGLTVLSLTLVLVRLTSGPCDTIFRVIAPAEMTLPGSGRPLIGPAISGKVLL